MTDIEDQIVQVEEEKLVETEEGRSVSEGVGDSEDS